MKKKLLYLSLALALAAGAQASLPMVEAAGSTCWQVCCPGAPQVCNTCCRTSTGGTVCTNRACP